MEKKQIGHEVSFKKADESKQIVYGEVYVPWTGEGTPELKDRDTHGHWATTETIEKMAHSFMANLRTYQIDKQHDEEADEGYVVESFIAREGDPDFTPGAWVLGTKVTKEETWQAIQKGEITGYSIGGSAVIVADEEGGEGDE